MHDRTFIRTDMTLDRPVQTQYLSTSTLRKKKVVLTRNDSLQMVPKII